MGIVTVSVVLKVSGVSLKYARASHPLFRDVAFQVRRGEVAVIMGDSGAGKTTLLHMIVGFLRAEAPPRTIRDYLWRGLFSVGDAPFVSGTIEIADQDVTHIEPSGRDIGLVMQRFSLYPNLTVRQNLAIPVRRKRIAVAERRTLIEKVAKDLEIDEFLERYPGDLSGGQMQRVAIGKLLLKAPAVALLDEAFSHLDWKLRQTLRKQVVERLKEGADDRQPSGVLFVSHDIEDAQTADKIIYLERPERTRGDAVTKVSVFEGGAGQAWQSFAAAAGYHIVQLVTPTGTRGDARQN